MTNQFIRRLKQKNMLRVGVPVQGCISTQQISPCQGNTETWQVRKQAQNANDSPRVTSKSVIQQETGAALLSINQRHFLAAAKNATLKHWELWKVFGLTVQLATNFVTFQNSKWTSLVKKTTGQLHGESRMFLCKTCWKVLVAFVIGSELKRSTVTSKREDCPEGLLQGLLLFCSNLQAN